MKASVSIDPRLIQLVGSKLYSEHPVLILVRELLQNSRDACLRKGVKPRIKLEIAENNLGTTVICRDNGIGMTQRQIVEDFLCLGKSKSAVLGEVGGFGIAKAAIMSNKYWKVETLDNMLDSDIFLEGGEIQKRKSKLNGTVIHVQCEKSFSTLYSKRLKLLALIYFSDVDVDLKITLNGQLAHQSDHAGFAKLFEKESSEIRTIDKHEFAETKISRNVDRTFAGTRISFRGLNIFRLNGLVQFISGDIWGSQDRPTNLIFEIAAHGKTPSDSDYPFSMSRESLTGNIMTHVDNLIDTHDKEILQSVVIASTEEREELQTYSIRDGRELQGSLIAEHEIYQPTMEYLGSELSSKLAQTPLSEATDQIFSDINSELPKLLVKEYDKSNPVWHAKILKAWAEVVRLTSHREEFYGIGITTETITRAARAQLDGFVYYIINPHSISTELSEEAMVLRMWGLAAHECTHRYVNSHNERFTTTMDSILSESCELLWNEVVEIARLLR